MSKYMDTKTGSLEESILGVWTEAAKKQQSETNKNDKSDDGEGLDAVQPKAVKKKFDNRKDKDIDNDGDTDSSDEFLHKKRKAISKAIAKKEGNAFGKALMSAKEKGEKTFVVAGKKYNVKEEVELSEKVSYVEYKFKNARDAEAAKKYFNAQQRMSFDVNDDNVRGGELMVDAGKNDMTQYHKEVMKKYSPKVMTSENFEVGTKERRDHTLNSTPGQSPEDFDQQVGVMQGKNNYMRETLAKMWGYKEGHNPFKDKKEEKKTKVEKTMTGKKATEVKVDPKIEETKEINAMKKQTKLKGKSLQAACGAAPKTGLG
jgi:hypothetical protein